LAETENELAEKQQNVFIREQSVRFEPRRRSARRDGSMGFAAFLYELLINVYPKLMRPIL